MSQEIVPARISRWLFTTNHKEIGILYIITSLFFFVAAGLLALTMRTQLSVSDNNLLSPDLYNQFVTVHGLLMIFWVLSPFAFGFANYIIPLQIGARDLAFPRLNAMSYWFYLVSGAAMIMSFAFGGAPDLGWTLYSPQTSFQFTPTIGLNVGAAGLILIVVSITMSSVNFLVLLDSGRSPPVGQRVLVLRSSGSLHRPISSDRPNRGRHCHLHQKTPLRQQVHYRFDGGRRHDQFHRLGSSHVRNRDRANFDKIVHRYDDRCFLTIRRYGHCNGRIIGEGSSKTQGSCSLLARRCGIVRNRRHHRGV